MKRKKPFLPLKVFLEKIQNYDLNAPEVELALKYSKRVHGKAKRDDGKPYLDQHIYPVTIDTVKYFKSDVNLQRKAVIVGLLHDALEDTRTLKREDFVGMFGEEITTDIMFLKKPIFESGYRTQKQKHMEHSRFIKQLESAPKCIQVMKCIDRINNLECTEISDKLRKKYERFIQDTDEYYLPMAKKVDVALYDKMFLFLNKLKYNTK